LDSIFEALAVNQSVKEFGILYFCQSKLNLTNSETLRFVENNSTITSLDFSLIEFEIVEMKILSECLLKNKSITNLNFNLSNYNGSFDFLQNNTLKFFSFPKVWDVLNDEEINALFENLRLNHSIIDLTDNGGSNQFNSKFQDFIDFMSESMKNVETFVFKNNFNNGEPYEFRKLLKNPKIKLLEFKRSFCPKSLVNFLNDLSMSDSIKRLIINENNMNDYIEDAINISNSSIEFFDFSGK
jgi:hypothetical protein